MDLFSYLLYDPEAPLLFNSGLFLVLFLGFYGLYILTEKQLNFRVAYVTLFSLFFYYKSSGIYFLLLILSSVWDYGLGIAMHGCTEQQRGRRRLLLLLSVVGNLGLLAFFKYTNFFINTYNAFATNDLTLWNIVLPVGISFYTFQTMSYSIDVYRGELKPTRNFFDFLFFVSFFPQLVAGPIVRASDFIAQIRQKLVLNAQDMSTAFWLIIGGLFKKAVISDYISINFVDRVFTDPMAYSGTENLLAVYGYTIQIYCDFSGYSDMAIGLALLMGFRLVPNFNSPYQALSITNFWQRWHISLSSWLRDYLYISLGGNRKGKIRTYINLMLTMLLGGLWHGANWRFVVWGALHGGALAVERALKPHTAGFSASTAGRVLGWIWTFHFVAFCWIFFRAATFDKAGAVLYQIGTDFSPLHLWTVLSSYAAIFVLIAIGYLLHFTPKSWEARAHRVFGEAPLPAQALYLAAMIWLVLQVASAGVQPFIYFQF